MNFVDAVKVERGSGGVVRRYIITIPRKMAEVENLQAGDMVNVQVSVLEKLDWGIGEV